MRMEPLEIVEPIDVGADRLLRSSRRGVGLVVNELGAQRREEALRDGVVPAVALLAHALGHAHRSERSTVVVAGVRAPAVGVVNERAAEPWARLDGTTEG